ncbi:PTS sugar transporter subunit IIA, partial [Brevibacillus laterosporus]
MQLINEQSVFPRLSAQSSTEVITILGNALREQGIVTERYVDEVLAREKVFPTGLQVDDL